MQNLQITLTNLHICYETKVGHPFSFEITIHSLQLSVRSNFEFDFKDINYIQTSTNAKRIGKTKENSLIIFKVYLSLIVDFNLLFFQLEKIHFFSIYWNTKCQSRLNLSFEYIIVSRLFSFPFSQIHFQKDLKSKIANNDKISNNNQMNYGRFFNFVIISNSFKSSEFKFSN